MTTLAERLAVLKDVSRIVVKIGSSLIADPSCQAGLNTDQLDRLAAQVAELRRGKQEVVIVSSGAVASGLLKLGLKERPRDLPTKQAAAAVGQSRLMWAYEKHFETHGLSVAQILLTHDDLNNRRRFLNSRNTILALLAFGVVPVINENDSVSVEEIRFGDNDNLAGMVAHLIDADLLVILSDVDGLYSADPRNDATAQRLSLIRAITPEIEGMAGKTSSIHGTGGMTSKLEAAGRVAQFGIPSVVAAGATDQILGRILRGDDVGSLFLPAATRLNSRKHWIAHTLRSKGRILLDDGAVAAIVQKNRSLLPSGVVAVEGAFEAGDPVSCLDASRKEVAKGLVNYSSEAAAKLCGAKTQEIAARLGYKDYDELVHRDNLVILTR